MIPVEEVLARKDELTERLRDLDLAAMDADEPVGDEHDTEEQTLLRAGIYECDLALEEAGYFLSPDVARTL